MNLCAIISEYNPFHFGHLYQIHCTRERIPDAFFVSVMSGNYVQRGDIAIWDKYTRAQLAVQAGGPDLVIELPLTASLSSAEGFARGAISLIHSLGCVTHLSFGSECGSADKLMQAAVLTESQAFQSARTRALADGLSYPAALHRAVRELSPDCETIFSQPNDTLGLEYCRALRLLSPDLIPIAITRTGAAHDSADVSSHFCSASYLRTLLYHNRLNSLHFLPSSSHTAVHTERIHRLSDMETAILPYLRRLSPKFLSDIHGFSEGLEYRFAQAAGQAQSLTELYETCKSKRYPLSRIRRAVLCTYLNITKELAALPAQYIRVLAMNDRGRLILKHLKSTCCLPVITKPTAARALQGDAALLWDLDMTADNLYHFPEPSGLGWKRSPAVML